MACQWKWRHAVHVVAKVDEDGVALATRPGGRIVRVSGRWHVEPCSPGSSSPCRDVIALLLGACPPSTADNAAIPTTYVRLVID